MILRGGPAGEWSFVDRVLAVASMLAEDLRCPGCGQPKHESWNPDSEGWYEVKEAVCQGCAALEQRRSQDDGYEPEQKRWVLDTRPADQPLRPWNPLGDEVDQNHPNKDDRDRHNNRSAEGQSVQGPAR